MSKKHAFGIGLILATTTVTAFSAILASTTILNRFDIKNLNFLENKEYAQKEINKLKTNDLRSEKYRYFLQINNINKQNSLKKAEEEITNLKNINMVDKNNYISQLTIDLKNQSQIDKVVLEAKKKNSSNKYRVMPINMLANSMPVVGRGSENFAFYIPDPSKDWDKKTREFLIKAKAEMIIKYELFKYLNTNPQNITPKQKEFYGQYIYISAFSSRLLNELYSKSGYLNEQITNENAIWKRNDEFKFIVDQVKDSENTNQFNYIKSISEILKFLRVMDFKENNPKKFSWHPRKYASVFYNNIESVLGTKQNKLNRQNYMFHYNPYLSKIISAEQINNLNLAVEAILTYLIENQYIDESSPEEEIIFNTIRTILSEKDTNNLISIKIRKNQKTIDNNEITKIRNQLNDKGFDLSKLTSWFKNVQKIYIDFHQESIQELIVRSYTEADMLLTNFLGMVFSFGPDMGAMEVVSKRELINLIKNIEKYPFAKNLNLTRENLIKFLADFWNMMSAAMLNEINYDQLISNIKNNKIFDFIAKYSLFTKDNDEEPYKPYHSKIQIILNELNALLNECESKSVNNIYTDKNELRKLINEIEANPSSFDILDKYHQTWSSKEETKLNIYDLENLIRFISNDLLLSLNPTRFSYKFFKMKERSINNANDLIRNSITSVQKIILENINHFSSLGNIAKRESIEDLDLSRITSSFLGKIIGMPIDSDNSYIDSFEKEINDILEFLDEETYFRNVADKLRIKKDAIFKELRSSLDSKYSLEFSLRLKALDNISDEEFFKILNEKGRIVIEALSLELQARNIR
ncbi:hypothetical protein KQ878_01910 [Mycoplasma zalophidermidis]|uniref:Uncharacterized protein n=1 Tax=Mycoplasma zalophidermidis TaxID=398174 RepID=A0ABS6DRT7_9MOLU|nr:hypothetical protein [Mycoplasma zalophidermidis]MBU4693636.1 hypothetical protein [Mycoplasma zalophidermidis]